MKETKFISESEYLTFKNRLREIFIKIVAGLALGALFGKFVGGSVGHTSAVVVWAIIFAGVPYAWSIIPVLVIGWFGNFIKLLVSLFLGWIVTPIALIYNFVQMKRYEQHAKTSTVIDEQEKRAV